MTDHDAERLAEIRRHVTAYDEVARRVVELEQIADLAKLMIVEMRLTPDGLIVKEKRDNSDAHYRLCSLLWPREPRAALRPAEEKPKPACQRCGEPVADQDKGNEGCEDPMCPAREAFR